MPDPIGFGKSCPAPYNAGMIPVERSLLIVGLLLLAGIAASKASARLGVPALLLFLIVGMLAGSDGPGGIPFDDPALTQYVGIVALVFILFAGGLQSERRTVKRVAWTGVSLATIGVLATTVLVGVFASWLLSLPPLEGFLLGAIVSSTDAAAVFSVIKTNNVELEGDITPLLEFESGSNDPAAIFLTTAILGLLTHQVDSLWTLIPSFFLEMGLGALFGFAGGKAIVAVVNRLSLESDGLYPVVTIALTLVIYSGTTLAHGSGFLAVYIAGIIVGNSEVIHRRSLTRFHDGLSWLMQIAMFLLLGLLVFPSRLVPIAATSVAIALFLIFVARPLSVFLSLAIARLNLRQKLLISWVGLRGAVPIVLATFPLVVKLPNADVYFNTVFFIVITSILIQGTTIPFAARLLHLSVPHGRTNASPLEFVGAYRQSSDVRQFSVGEASRAIGLRIVELGLPPSALIVLIARNHEYLAPRGGTVLQQGDELTILADLNEMGILREILKSA